MPQADSNEAVVGTMMRVQFQLARDFGRMPVPPHRQN